MRTARRKSESGVYHVIHRGVGRQIIFEDDEDCRTFLDILSCSLSNEGVDLLCWCLMSNHFHLLVRGELPSLANAMRKACGPYAQRFNSRHGRTGHLFQERYRSEPVEDDAYLLVVARYIHQNPVKAGICQSCAEYRWSSYHEYADVEDGPCSKALILETVGGVDAFRDFHQVMPQDAQCLDVDCARSATRAMPDEDAIAFADTLLGDGAIEKVKGWERAKRDDALRKLIEAGLSIRQIERLTGVGRGIVYRAVKS